MKQNIKRRARNFPVRKEMKSVFKNALKLIKDGKIEELKKLLPHAFSVIDTACKKKIIQKNNAARKKSRLARGLNILENKKDVKADKAEAKA